MGENASDLAALRALVAQLHAAVGNAPPPANATGVPSRRMGRPREGSASEHGGRWWARLRLADGRQTAPLEVPRPVDGTAYDRAYAKAVTRAWQRRYDATGALPAPGEATAGPEGRAALPTAYAHAAAWIAGETHRTQKDEAGYLELHLKPARLGAVPLDKVTQADVVAWVRWLRARKSQRDGKPLAPRYVRSIYDVVRRAFEHAVMERKLPGSPFAGTARYLPAVADKHAGARAGWKLSRAEAHALTTDARVPPDRRALYALALYTGARFGELSALRWAAYEPDAPVLGRLTFAVAYNRRTKAVEHTKTRATKLAPVHPALAAALAAWWARGWQEHQGRAPTRADLVVPAKHGRERGVYGAAEMLARDLTALQIDVRHFHALRHTFVSLALDAGARGEVLKRVTHAPPSGAFDLYAAPDWRALCAEVARLDLAPEAVGAPAASNGTDCGNSDAAEVDPPQKNQGEMGRPQPDSKRLKRARLLTFPAKNFAESVPQVGNGSGNGNAPESITQADVYVLWARGALVASLDDAAVLA